MAVTLLWGWERPRKGREQGERECNREEEKKRIQRKWHPVKLRKIVRRTKLNLSATLSEMKGDFDKIISFHRSLSSFSSLLWRLHCFYAPPFYLTSSLLPSILHLIACLPPFVVWLFFFCINAEEWRKTPRVVLLFIIKSAGVHKKTMEEKLTFYLTRQEAVNKKKLHARNFFTSQYNHHFPEKYGTLPILSVVLFI